MIVRLRMLPLTFLVATAALACLATPSTHQKIEAAASLLSQAKDPPGEPSADRLAQIAAEINRELPKFDADLAKPDFRPTVRDLTYAALAKLVLNSGEPAARQAEALLRRTFDLQEMNPASPNYGTVPWRPNDSSVSDANAIEFTMHSVGPILLRFGDKLSPECKKYLDPHVRAGIAAIRRHRVPVTYTNIFLMKTINLVLLGEASKDPKAASEGYAMLEEWIAYTRQYGISEYASSAYYAVDLHCLGLGYLFAARPKAKARFKACLDYLWTDISAHFLPGRSNGATMAGPHSRDYDFLGGTGALTDDTFVEGYQPEIARGYRSPGFEKVMIVLTLGEGGYHPAERIRALTRLPERLVQSRWGPKPGQDRTVWLTQHFALGSTSADYGPQDKPIALDWVSTKALPTLQIVPDASDQPYGHVKVKDKSGHSKPRHWPLHPVAVQDKGALLVLLDLDPAREKEAGTSLATNVILPAQADSLYLGSQKVEAGKPFTLPGSPKAVVGVREGRAGVALRIFRADGCGQPAARLELKADAEGLKYGAARYAAYHYLGTKKQLSDSHVRAAVLILAGRCDSDADLAALMRQAETARISEKADAGRWDVAVRLGKVLLEAGRDLNGRALLYRRINGRAVQPDAFRLNGIDQSKELGKAL
jgi:hypothetical protein